MKKFQNKIPIAIALLIGGAGLMFGNPTNVYADGDSGTNTITINGQDYTYSTSSSKSDNDFIDKAEKGVADHTESTYSKYLSSMQDVLNQDEIPIGTKTVISNDGTGSVNYLQYGIGSEAQNVSATVTGEDGNQYNITYLNDGTISVTGPNGPLSKDDLSDKTISQSKVREGCEAARDKMVTSALDQDNYLTKGWFGDDGLIKTCKDDYVNGVKATSKDCKAYEAIVESDAGNSVGVGVSARLEKLYNDIANGNLTPEEASTLLNDILNSANGQLSTEAIAQLNKLQSIIDTAYSDEQDNGCPDGEILDEDGNCISGEGEGYEPGGNIDTGNYGGEVPSGTADVGEEAEEESTEAEEDAEKQEEAEEESEKEKEETAGDKEYSEDALTLFNEYKSTLANVNSAAFGTIYKPEEIEVDGLKGKLYVQTAVGLMSEDSEYFSKLTKNDDGTFSYKTSDGENGQTYVYSYGYDVDGKVVSDVVITSMQTAYLDIYDDSGLVKDSSEAKFYGQGNTTMYTTYGYGEVEMGETKYQFVVDANYQHQDDKSIEDTTTVNFASTTETAVPNSVQSLIKKSIYKMEKYNDESFKVDIRDIIKSDSNPDGYDITVTQSTTSVPVEFKYNGSTYSYDAGQIVTISNGTIYDVTQIMQHDMVDLSTLIDAGFVIKRDGVAITSKTIDDLTYSIILSQGKATSDTKDGKKDDTKDDKKDTEETEETTETKETKDDTKQEETTQDDTKEVTHYDTMKLTSLGDWLTDDKTKEVNSLNPELVWTDGDKQYYLPKGVADELDLKFYNTETQEYETVTVSEALAKKYIKASDLMDELEKQGISVVKADKTENTSFYVTANIPKNATKEVTKFYEDGQYIYSFEYKDAAKNIVIYTADGIKYSLDYALEKNIFTIDEILAQIDEQNEASPNNTIEYFKTSKETFKETSKTDSKIEVTAEAEEGTPVAQTEGTLGPASSRKEDGTIEIFNVSDEITHKITYPGGETITTYKDGRKIRTYEADGNNQCIGTPIARDEDGTTHESHPEGDASVVERIVSPDGTVTLVYEDGHKEVQNSSSSDVGLLND